MKVKDINKEFFRSDRSRLGTYYIQKRIREKYGYSLELNFIENILDFYEDFLDTMLELNDENEIDDDVVEGLRNEIRQRQH